MAERCLYSAEGGGSIPSAPTIPDLIGARQPGSLGRGGVAAAMAASLALVLSGCGAPGSAATAPAPKTSAQPASEYVIGPGDTLGIFVYRAPELSIAALPVRPDGRISVPLIPEVVAAGKTSVQLSNEIAEHLKEYVKDPLVTVMVQSFVGPFDRQIRVIGQATEPLAIAYRDHMTVLDLMIAVKGLTRFAAGNRAVIVRHEPGGHQKTIRVHLNDLLKDGDISQNVAMEPGDILIIPQTWF
jgi:polysaccharide export outer membrane protein